MRLSILSGVLLFGFCSIALAADTLERKGIGHAKPGEKLMLNAEGQAFKPGTVITVTDTRDDTGGAPGQRTVKVLQMLGGNKSVMVEVLE